MALWWVLNIDKERAAYSECDRRNKDTGNDIKLKGMEKKNED